MRLPLRAWKSTLTSLGFNSSSLSHRERAGVRGSATAKGRGQRGRSTAFETLQDRAMLSITTTLVGPALGSLAVDDTPSEFAPAIPSSQFVSALPFFPTAASADPWMPPGTFAPPQAPPTFPTLPTTLPPLPAPLPSDPLPFTPPSAGHISGTQLLATALADVGPAATIDLSGGAYQVDLESLIPVQLQSTTDDSNTSDNGMIPSPVSFPSIADPAEPTALVFQGTQII